MMKLLLILATIVILPIVSFAQDDAGLSDTSQSSGGAKSDSGLGEEMESLFNDQQKQTDQAEDKAEEQSQQQPEKPSEQQVKELSDLAKLAPFSDIAMLQRRFLPRTGRFEAYLGADTILNDPFFTSLGLDARLAYFFTEKYGVELQGLMLTSSNRQVTKDLKDKFSIGTSVLVAPKSYFGADFKWSPIYGKLTYRNRKIIHYDMYFSLGGGSTSHSSGSSPTIHVGTGQNFAITKSLAFRWDVGLNIYNATTKDTTTGQSSSASFQNLFLGAGISYFFPEAGYR